MRLGGKRALVTGGSEGIGLAIAEAFSREGADVLIVGRNGKKLDAAREQLGNNVETLSADLSASAGIDAVVEHARRGPPLDILVNNAGVAFLVPFETSARTSSSNRSRSTSRRYSSSRNGCCRISRRARLP